jgi:hypothetical protein
VREQQRYCFAALTRQTPTGATYDKNGIIEACDAAKVALTGVGCESNVDEFKYWLVSRI